MSTSRPYIRLMSWFGFLSILLTTPLVFSQQSGASPSTALVTTSGAGAPTSSFDMPVPGTNDTSLRITIDHGTPEQSRADSPAALREQSAEHLNRQKELCRKGHGLAGFGHEVVEEYTADAAAFYVALAVSTSEEMQKDPGTLRHYYEQNITDGFAHANFVIFMALQRGTESLFKLIGLRYDPCRYILKGKPDPGESTLQKVFSPLIRPISMTVGAVGSEFILDVVRDTNLRKCSLGMLGLVNKVAADKACDDSFEEWVIKSKIRKYMPTLISSMIGTAVMESSFGLLRWAGNKSAAKLEAGGTRKVLINITLRTFKVISTPLRVAGKSTWAGWVVEFGYTLGFWLMSKYIQPYFDEWWGTKTKGQDVTIGMNRVAAEIDRLSNEDWVWKPTKEISPLCRGASQWGLWLTMRWEKLCHDPNPSLETRIKSYTDFNREWRKFLLRDLDKARKDWQDYSLNFTNTFADAFNFYKVVTSAIYKKRSKPSEATWLDGNDPYPGKDEGTAIDVCTMDEAARNRLRRATRVAKEAFEQLEQNPRYGDTQLGHSVLLQNIWNGLSATDCDKPLQGLPRGVFKELKIEGEKTPEVQRLERGIRLELYMQAMAQLDLTLKTDPIYRVNHRLRDSSTSDEDLKRIQNPFARVKIALSETKVLPPGVATIKSMNADSRVFTQEFKERYKEPMGSVRVQEPSDFHLASMLCGPDMHPGIEEKRRIYKEYRESLKPSTGKTVSSAFNTALSFIGLAEADSDSATGSADDTDEKLTADQQKFDEAANAYFEKIKAPKASLAPQNCYSSGNHALISRGYGSHAQFCPPRLIPQNKVNFCTAYPKNLVPSANSGPTGPYDLHDGIWTINGETLPGFLEIVKKYARTEAIGQPGKDYLFETWWNKEVRPTGMNVVQRLRKDYDDLMTKDFLPVLRSKETAEFNGRTINKGVTDTLRAEVNFYFNVLRQTIVSTSTITQETANAVKLHSELTPYLKQHFELAFGLLADIETIRQSVTTIERLTKDAEPTRDEKIDAIFNDDAEEAAPSSNQSNAVPEELLSIYQKRYVTAIEKNKKALNIYIEVLEEAMTQLEPQGLSPDALETVRGARSAAFSGLKAAVTEIVGLHQMMSTMDLEQLR